MKILNSDDRCPHCNTLIKRIDKTDATKSFYAVKGMTTDRLGMVASKCNQCGGEIRMPVRKVNTKIKSTLVRKARVIPKN